MMSQRRVKIQTMSEMTPYFTLISAINCLLYPYSLNSECLNMISMCMCGIACNIKC